MRNIIWSVCFILLTLVTLGLTACGSEVFEDNQVYIVEQGGQLEEDTVVGWLDIHAAVPFTSENSYQQQLEQGKLFLTASDDGRYIFYEERLQEQDESVLKGPGQVLVNLYLIDQTRQTIALIAAKRPFIARTGWNEDETMVAFSGEGMLTVYDVEKQKCVLVEELAAETVTSFFWSPLESRKLYLEQPRSAIGSLYYMESQKKAELYETTEQLYYKAQLDDTYYYGTRWGVDQDSQEAIYTVLANQEKETVKVIGKGSYRDHYMRSVLLSGENNFGLTYIANINQVSKAVTLTEAYVYDAKFITGGKMIYITDDESLSDNFFTLHLINALGEEVRQWRVSGSSLLLSEDGKVGYGSGPQREIVSFEQQTVQKEQQIDSADAMLTILRGASSVYARLLLGQAVSPEEQEQFYANLEGLEQLQKEQTLVEGTAMFWIRILSAEENELGRLCTVTMLGQNSAHQWKQQQVQFQMVEHNQRWYVLHFKAGEIGEEH